MENAGVGYLNQCISRHSVLKVDDRHVTDKIIRIIFGVSFLLWLIVIVYCVILPVKGDSFLPSFLDFRSLDVTRTFILIGFILAMTAFTLIEFFALRWMLHLTKVALGIFFVLMLSSIAHAYYYTSSLSVLLAMQIICICILIINLLSTEWFHVSDAILKEACKMIISVPSTALLALLTCLLNAFLILAISVIFYKLLEIESRALKIIATIMNLFCGSWTIIVVSVLMFMTLSGTFAEYYWIEEKDSVSFRTVSQIFAINLKYHIGTAAMHHPFLGGLGGWCFVCGESFRLSFLIYCYNLVVDMVLLRIALLGAAVTCSIKGENFFISMGNSVNICFKNWRRILAVVKLLELVLLSSSGLVVALAGLSIYYYLDGNYSPNDDKWHTIFIVLSTLGISVPLLALISCLVAAYFSIMLCFEEEADCLGHDGPQETCAMSSNLRSALSHAEGPPKWFRNSCRCCTSCNNMR